MMLLEKRTLELREMTTRMSGRTETKRTGLIGALKMHPKTMTKKVKKMMTKL